MHLFHERRMGWLRRAILPLLIAAGILAAFVLGFRQVSGRSGDEQQARVERAIRRSLVTCYAVEGAYPADLSYLEEHYGLLIDHGQYVVEYEMLGSNILPSIRVAERGNGAHNEGGGAD